MAGHKNRMVEVSAETFDMLVEVGQFPESMDECIKRLINGSHSFVTKKMPDGKRRKVRKKIGCQFCDRVFVGGQGYASHLRHFHPEHYRPAKPVPLAERKTVIYRKADGTREQVRVEDMKEHMEKEA